MFIVAATGHGVSSLSTNIGAMGLMTYRPDGSKDGVGPGTSNQAQNVRKKPLAAATTSRKKPRWLPRTDDEAGGCVQTPTREVQCGRRHGEGVWLNNTFPNIPGPDKLGSGGPAPPVAAAAAAADAGDKMLGVFLGGLWLQKFSSLFVKEKICLSDLHLLDDVLAHMRMHKC